MRLTQHGPRPGHGEVTQRGPGPETQSGAQGCMASGSEASRGPPSWPRGPRALTELAPPQLSSHRPAGLTHLAWGQVH